MKSKEEILDSIVKDWATPITRQDCYEAMDEWHEYIENISLFETQVCLQTLINRVRQAVNKKELILNPPFQKSFDDALYVIKKYSKPDDSFRLVKSKSKEQYNAEICTNCGDEFYDILGINMCGKCFYKK